MPENQNEGQGGDAPASGTPPEDVLFGGSEPKNTNQPATPAAQDAPPVDEPVSTETPDESPADALAEPSPAEALAADEPEGDAAEPSSAPEAYEPFDLPDGVGAFGDDAVQHAFGGVARELGLTQEQAQKLMGAVAPAQVEAQAAQVAAVSKSWLDASRDDPEIGGANYKATNAHVRAAAKKFGSPGLLDLLTNKAMPLANHPELRRFMAAVGKSVRPDSSIVTGRNAPEQKALNVDNPLATPEALQESLFGETS